MPVQDRRPDCRRTPVTSRPERAAARRRLHRARADDDLRAGEVLAQAPDFQPELTVVGTTSGGMTFGEEYYRALQSGRTSHRRSPHLDRQLPAAKAGDRRAGGVRSRAPAR